MSVRRLGIAALGLFLGGGLLVLCCTLTEGPAHTPGRVTGILGQAAGIPAGGSLQRRYGGDGGGDALLIYEWTDPWSVRYVSWAGDTPTVAASSRERQLTLATSVNTARLREVIDSFGYEDRGSTSYSGEADLQRQFDERARRAATRGIILERSGEHFSLGVDYDWVVQQSRADLRQTAAELQRVARRYGYETHRELLGVMAAFVQGMTYAQPPAFRRDATGRRFGTCGITMPLETLYNGWGDCDSKSLLLASLLANIPGQRVIFLRGHHHLFVGVRGVARRGDHYIDVRGVQYILIETTAPWPIGRVPQDIWQGGALHGYESVPVDLYGQPAPIRAAAPQASSSRNASRNTAPPIVPLTTPYSVPETVNPRPQTQRRPSSTGNPMAVIGLVGFFVLAFFGGRALCREDRLGGASVKSNAYSPVATATPAPPATSQSPRAAPHKVFTQLLSRAYLQYCDAVQTLWRKHGLRLGKAFEVEVVAYLLLHVDHVLVARRQSQDIRTTLRRLGRKELLGWDDDELDGIIDARLRGYATAMRGQKEMGDYIAAMIRQWGLYLGTCPDAREEMVEDPSIAIVDVAVPLELLHGLVAIEARYANGFYDALCTLFAGKTT